MICNKTLLLNLVLKVKQIMLKSDNLTLKVSEHLRFVIWLNINLCQQKQYSDPIR